MFLHRTDPSDPHPAQSWPLERATLQGKPKDQLPTRLRIQEPAYLDSPRNMPCCKWDLTTSNRHAGSLFQACKFEPPQAYCRLRRGWDHLEGGKILLRLPHASPKVGILRSAVKFNLHHKAESSDGERTSCRTDNNQYTCTVRTALGGPGELPPLLGEEQGPAS